MSRARRAFLLALAFLAALGLIGLAVGFLLGGNPLQVGDQIVRQASARLSPEVLASLQSLFGGAAG